MTKSKIKKGTAENPHEITGWFEVVDLDEGTSECFTVIENNKSVFDSFSKLSDAVAAMEAKQKDDEAFSIESQEGDWIGDNKANQQTVAHMNFRVTKNTTPESIKKFHAEVLEQAKLLKKNPPAKMPKFKPLKKDLSKYKIVKVTIVTTVEEQNV